MVAGLSYANRRRIEIARALASRPRILLLDEPTAGMNPAETLELAEQIKSLNGLGLTVLLIEHKLDVVTTLADTVVRARPWREDRARARRTRCGGTRRCCAPISAATRRRRWRRRADALTQLLLEFKDVDTYYGDLHVLKQVNYTIGEGEIVSLLGGNASGKSTTMKTIMGVVRPTRGTRDLSRARRSSACRPPNGCAAASRRCWRRAGCSRA